MSDEHVDVSRLVGEIRDEVRTRFEAGEYPPEVEAELIDAYGAAHLADAFPEHLKALREFHFSGDIEAASKKKVVGPVIAGGRRAVRGGLKWYTNALLAQLERFAGRVGEALLSLSARVDKASDVAERATADTAVLSERLEELTKKTDELVARVREMAALRSPSFDAERRMDYLGFEHRFRGPSDAVVEQQRAYVELFADAPGRVLDVGCGRGEFLGLLREAGIDSYGIDRYPDMVAAVREQRLEVVEAEALEHLASLEPGSLGGIFAAQVIEHFVERDVAAFFEAAARALHAGGVLVVETVNPGSLYVFAHALYLDIGHSRPLHPQLLAFLAERAGFRDVRIEYSGVPQDSERPEPLPRSGDASVDALSERIDENFKRVSDLVFGPQDYAVIARR